MKTETKTYWVVYTLGGECAGHVVKHSDPRGIIGIDATQTFGANVLCDSIAEARILADKVRKSLFDCHVEEVEITTQYRVRRLRSNFHGDC